LKINPEVLSKLITRITYYIEDAEVIGLGTGRTMTYVVNYLSKYELLKGKTLVPSSIDTALKLRKLGFKVTSPLSTESLDVYIDSADEVDPKWNMIKGGGAALTMEKILTYYSRKRVFVVTEDKLVHKLCSKHYIPLDVVPESLTMVTNYLSSRGFDVRIREGSGKRGPVRSDFGGLIIDVKPPSNLLSNLEALDKLLTYLPGVISSGLFVGLVDVGYILLSEELREYVMRD